MSVQNIIHKQSHTHLPHLKISRLKSALFATAFKQMKLRRIFLPAIAMMAIALGTIPVHSAPAKIKIGVAMSNFDDVWLTYVRDAITKWASAHPDVQLTIVDGS